MKDLIAAGYMTVQALIAPNSPAMNMALTVMADDYSTCSAYYTHKSEQLASPIERVLAIARAGHMAGESERIAELINLEVGRHTRRYIAIYNTMQVDINGGMWYKVFAGYDTFCEELHDNPGNGYVKRLNKLRMK